MEEQHGSDDERDPRAAELYLSGLSQDRVAEELTVSQSWVSRSLRRSGIPDRTPRWDAARDQRAAELYLSGLTQDQVAGQIGSSRDLVTASLKRSGVEIRANPREVDRARRMAEQPRPRPTIEREARTSKLASRGVGRSRGRAEMSDGGSRIQSQRLAWDATRDQRVAELYLSGLSEERVAEEVGSSRNRVAESLVRSGVPARSRGSAGPRNGSWNGGRNYDKNGYVLIHAPWHPRARRNHYVLEHRLVMERILGRFLEPAEVVHHRNGDRADNRPENLALFASNAEHLAVELLGCRPMWTEDGLRRLAEVWQNPDRHRHGPHVPRGTGARGLRREAILELKSDPESAWDRGPVAAIPHFPLGQRGSGPSPGTAAEPAQKPPTTAT
jgi:hypothetical protein